MVHLGPSAGRRWTAVIRSCAARAFSGRDDPTRPIGRPTEKQVRIRMRTTLPSCPSSRRLCLLPDRAHLLRQRGEDAVLIHRIVAPSDQSEIAAGRRWSRVRSEQAPWEIDALQRHGDESSSVWNLQQQQPRQSRRGVSDKPALAPSASDANQRGTTRATGAAGLTGAHANRS